MKQPEWQCEDCGIIHNHSKHKHSMCDHIDWDKVKRLEFNPECNCGAREAHERGFIDLPDPALVPSETMEEIESLIS